MPWHSNYDGMGSANIDFNPPILFASERYCQMWHLLHEMKVAKTVVITTRDMNILRLSFDDKEQAMMFRLRLE